MKTLFKLIVILLCCTACEDYQPQTHHLSVLVDLSDTESYMPSAKEILAFVPQQHSSDGVELTLRYVSDTRYAPSYQFKLGQGEVGFLSNEDTRRRKHKKLLRQFTDSLAVTSKRPENQRSEIFRLLTSELHRLSKTDGTKTIVLFSDLEEHSFFSVYNKRDFWQLLKQPERIAQRFAEATAIPKDLSGVTIHIIYTPKLEEDAVFTAMVNLYRKLLESRGAKLLVTRSQVVHL